MTTEGTSTEIDPKSLKGKIAIGIVGTAIILALIGMLIPSAQTYAVEVVKLFLDAMRTFLPAAGA